MHFFIVSCILTELSEVIDFELVIFFAWIAALSGGENLKL
jgi:hypothetical protein